MKKSLLIITLLAAICSGLFAGPDYPFEVKKSGKGQKSLIFIPGYGCSGAVWDETRAQFEKDYTCYVLTMPGFAGVKPEENPDIFRWVSSISAYIRENHISKPVLIGHSLGGTIAQWVASDYPSLVSGIVVVDALPCLSALSNPGFKALPEPDCTKFRTGFLSLPPASFEQMQKTAIASMVTDTSRIAVIVDWSMKSDRNTQALIYCQLLNTDLRDTIKAVHCPALILLEPGFKSMKSQITDQYSKLGGANLHYGNNGLHFIMYDDKSWFFQELKTFLH